MTGSSLSLPLSLFVYISVLFCLFTELHTYKHTQHTYTRYIHVRHTC